MLDKFNTKSIYIFIAEVYRQRNHNIEIKIQRDKLDEIVERVNNQQYTDGNTSFKPSAFKKMGHFTALFINYREPLLIQII